MNLEDLKKLNLNDAPKRISRTACRKCGGQLAKPDYCNHCGTQKQLIDT